MKMEPNDNTIKRKGSTATKEPNGKHHHHHHQQKSTYNTEKQRQSEQQQTIIHKKQPSYNRRVDPPLYKLIRSLAVAIWVIVITIFIWFIAPFSAIFVNPILKLIGVRPFYYPLEICSRIWARGLCWLWGIKVIVQGKDHVRKCDGHPTVIMYSHCSNIDPIILLGYTSIPPRFIFKKELLYFVPLVFLLAYLVGHIPIDRKKHHSAVESINHSADAIKKSKAGVAISPEGTRSTDGQIKDFKKGAFHLSKRANANILPACFWGTFEVWPNSDLLPNSGVVFLRFLPSYRASSNDDIDELVKKTKDNMTHTLVEEYPKKFDPFPHPPNIINPLIFLAVVGVISYMVLQVIDLSTTHHLVTNIISKLNLGIF